MLRQACHISEAIHNEVKLVLMIVCLVIIDPTPQGFKLGAQTLLKVDPMNKGTIHRDISFVRPAKEGYISGQDHLSQGALYHCHRTAEYPTEKSRVCQDARHVARHKWC